MRRLWLFLLLIAVALPATVALDCAPATVAADHGGHHGQPDAPPEHKATAGLHGCIGCALPDRGAARTQAAATPALPALPLRRPSLAGLHPLPDVPPPRG